MYWLFAKPWTYYVPYISPLKRAFTLTACAVVAHEIGLLLPWPQLPSHASQSLKSLRNSVDSSALKPSYTVRTLIEGVIQLGVVGLSFCKEVAVYALLQTSKPPKRGELSVLFVMMATPPLCREGLIRTNTIHGGLRDSSYKLVRLFTSMWTCTRVEYIGFVLLSELGTCYCYSLGSEIPRLSSGSTIWRFQTPTNAQGCIYLAMRFLTTWMLAQFV